VHPAIHDNRLYGRGSCDVKSFLACTLAGLGSLDLQALEKPLAVVPTADVVVGCVGAKRLARQHAFATRSMIIAGGVHSRR
jgi:acetylornithine deacetylase